MKRALAIVANTRLPSERAQGLQVVQSAAAFARSGLEVEILHARRARELPLPAGSDLLAHCGVPGGARPSITPIECIDWIESVPRALQFWPSRLQEWTFSSNAARRLLQTSLWFTVQTVQVLHSFGLTSSPKRMLISKMQWVPAQPLNGQPV